MANLHPLIGSAILALGIPAHAQKLDDAEVRISYGEFYGEFKQLLARAEPVAKPSPKAPPPVLLSARLRFAMADGRPLINATFRTLGFGDEIALVPLIAGDVSLESQVPADAVVVSEAESLFETGELPAGQSVVLDSGAGEETLAAGQIRPLPNKGHRLHIRLLDSRETREALSPPEPSAWTWQNQALVMPIDGDLVYQVIARASAADGSGVEALLPLPPDAQDIAVAGDDLVSQVKMRGANRELGLSLVWKTRGILDRQLVISYRMPLRPLDRTWKLQARFIIATSPLLDYAAEGLSGPLSPQGLPATLAEALKGSTCQQLEAGPSADLTATPVPVAATEEGVVNQAEWSVKIEPDGSMLATGVLTIEHKGPLGFVFDTPQDMKLLSCELAGRPVSPVDLGIETLAAADTALPPLAALAHRPAARLSGGDPRQSHTHCRHRRNALAHLAAEKPLP